MKIGATTKRDAKVERSLQSRNTSETLPSQPISRAVTGQSGKLIINFMSKFAILREFWSFLRVRKKWWITPIVLFLVTLGLLLVLAKGSALAPFIYTLF